MTALRILIVEDEALVARDLRNTLVKLGYEVTFVARTAGEALASVRETMPDLALLDIRLADGSDGIEAAHALQRDFKVPVVYLTAHADERTIQRARETQPYGYLLKPFHESELRSVVELAVARHQANARLAASEALIVSTLKSMAEGVISTDLFGKITFMNLVAEKMTGWTLADATGKPLHEVFRISSPAGQSVEALGMTAFGGESATRSILLTTKDDRQEWIEDNTAPIRDAEGGLAGIVVLFRSRPRVDELEISTEQPENGAPWPNLAGIVHSIVDPLVAMDAEWKITYLNPQAASILDGPRDNLLGKEVWECLPPSIHRLYYHEFSQALARGKSRSFEMELEASRRWFEVQLYPFGNGLLALLRDITTRKATEEQERKLEKLESLGLLARGFAHDFNNLLTVLLGNLSLAEMQIDPETSGHPELVTAKQATLQAQGLVQHLLTFARGGMPIKQPTDMGRLVREWAAEWPKKDGIEYKIEISDELMQSDVDRKQIARFLHNVIRNAEQAILRSGEITLRLLPSYAATDRQTHSGLPRETNWENWLLLEISDNGEGILPEDQQRVFEPYFTTRDDANASGLGLTVCESIAKAHGANLVLESTPQQGTTLSLWMPAYDPPAGELPAKVEPEAPALLNGHKRPRRVLILEDEVLIRHLMVATLKSIDCEVTTTADGSETIARFEEARAHEEPFQLLIMDLSIPSGMGGLQAMDRIRNIDPAAKAIVSSGYCDDPVLSRYMDYGFRAVLPKPYQPNELKAMVERMLKE